MEYAYLGRTGLRVSRLCLGTMNFGGMTDEKESFKIMDLALDAGINFFDTANMYGGSPRMGGHRGLTEELIGRWFATGGGRREKTVLATKIYHAMGDPNDGPNDVPGMSAYKTRRHIDAALSRLKTDHIELLYIHDQPSNVSWEEKWDSFSIANHQGKVDYFGCSNISAYKIALAQKVAEKRNFLGFACNQSKYNLCCRLPELELLPSLIEQGMGFMAYSPLHGGQLTGKILEGLEPGQRTNKYAGKLSDERLNRLAAFKKLCDDFGEPCANVATAWLLTRPGLTSVLIGPRTAEQFEDSLRAVELTLPDDLLKAIDSIFPGFEDYGPLIYLNETPRI